MSEPKPGPGWHQRRGGIHYLGTDGRPLCRYQAVGGWSDHLWALCCCQECRALLAAGQTRRWHVRDIPRAAVLAAADAWSRAYSRVGGPTVEMRDTPGVWDALVAAYPTCPGIVLWRALERDERAGLLDCGTSLRYAWPTDAGRDWLAELGPSREGC